jgi:hypothetical protein
MLPLEAFLSLWPLTKAEIARCSEAYVINDANTTPPATINPSFAKRAVIPRTVGDNNAILDSIAIPDQ